MRIKVLGNNYWWVGVAKYQEYHQMASYVHASVATNLHPAAQQVVAKVNVDPSRDKGSSFMDAGAIYFKALLCAFNEEKCANMHEINRNQVTVIISSCSGGVIGISLPEFCQDRANVDRTKAIAFRNGLTYCLGAQSMTAPQPDHWRLGLDSRLKAWPQ